MADTQTLEALAEALLTARIAHTSGTEAQWTAANPVLLRGEVGVVAGTSPARFKIGDGATAWTALPWGNLTALAQLAQDATHRLVTDTEKARWNAACAAFEEFKNSTLVIECTIPGME